MLPLQKQPGFASNSRDFVLRNKSILLTTIGALILLLGVSAIAFLHPRSPAKSKDSQPSSQATSTLGEYTYLGSLSTSALGVDAGPGPYSYFNGLLTPGQFTSAMASMSTTSTAVLKDTYDIFMISASTTEYDYPPSTAKDFYDYYSANPPGYFDDGVITSGKYLGWHRVIARFPIPGGSLGGPSYVYFTFATQNYKTFVLHSAQVGLMPNPNWFNTKVVVGADNFPVHFPSTIAMGKFVLIRNDFGSTTDPYGHNISTGTNPTTSTASTSPVSGLQLFSEPADLPTSLSANLYIVSTTTGATTSASYLATANHYIQSPTRVLARDSAGIGFTYSLSFANFASTNNPADKKTGDNSGWPYYGNLEVDPSSPNLYSTYGALFSDDCGMTSDYSYILKNISASDVRDTGVSWQGVELYTLADTNSPLTQLVYNLKASYEAFQISQGSDGTTSLTLPLQTYAQKNPILLFKDPWGRWVAVGEQQFFVMSGCGKPVLYLYPTKPTKVSVTFVRTPRFATDIPTYAGGWNVLAEPNGKLHDLQPQLTNCSAIDTAAFGSEYAKRACESSVYPYLYWSGTANGTYPTPTGGWVVPRSHVGSFLQAKLQALGLSQKEQQDMLSFWVPELLKKTVPYYRLSFFQTAQMNAFIPMHITPQPNSLLRVFLDWTPLSALPAQMPKPQALNPFKRSGFTVVEWGGLER